MGYVGRAIGAVIFFALPASGAVISGDVMGRIAPAEQAPITVVEGTWTADTRAGWTNGGEPRWQLSLRNDAGDNHWGFSVPESELQGAPAAAVVGTAGDVRFSWSREAGTFRFTGSFDRGRGTGRYAFSPDASYLKTMEGQGHRLDPAGALRFAVLDITSSYVRELAGAGYGGLATEDLVRMRIHRVAAAEIREWRAAGFTDLSPDMLVRLRIHRVTPEFARGLAERGYRGVPADDLVRMRIHRVTLEEVDELKGLGFGGLAADELVKFRIHKVTPLYIRQMKEVGFASATEDQLVRMRIHRVDAQFVRDARADGYAMTTPSDAVDLAIHGPRFARARRR